MDRIGGSMNDKIERIEELSLYKDVGFKMVYIDDLIRILNESGPAPLTKKEKKKYEEKDGV